MNNLGLSDYDLNIRVYMDVFRYDIIFRFSRTGKFYTGSGTAPSPGQCFDLAMAYLAEATREAGVDK